MNNDFLAEVIGKIRRGDPASLDTYLTTIVKGYELGETKTKFHVHMIATDGNGNIRLDDFISFVVHHIIAYVIPRSRFEEAKQKDDKEGLGRHHLRLFEEARKLFTPLKTTGEGGEMLLFILGEVLLGLPQLFCKMSVKTSGEVHYHGTDGIHVGIGDDDKLELYWGEAKLRKSFNEGANECIKSLSPFLCRNEDADHEDLLLLQTHLDLCKPEYTAAFKQVLDKDNPTFNNVIYCGLCFIGFDHNLYSAQTTKDIINKNCGEWQNAIQQKLKDKKLDGFNIHFFCLPFVSIEEFRSRFLRKIGLANE